MHESWNADGSADFDAMCETAPELKAAKGENDE